MAFNNLAPNNKAIEELRDSVNVLNESTKQANRIMIILTIAIFILTFVLVLQGFKLIK